MSDLHTILGRAVGGATPPPDGFERMLRRRDRKRRNQRITAGVVGIAVFVAAIWFVTTGGPFGQSQTEGVPGGGVTGPAVTGPAVTGPIETGPTETGPAETGPAETGPAVTGPVIGNTGDPSSVGFGGLPPEGATPSKPLRGELVMKSGGAAWVNVSSWYQYRVYADGRLIWSKQVSPFTTCCIVPRWIEQRLTPEGVELLRSGAVPLGGEFENPGEQLPVSAWEDPELRPYVPSRYGACFVEGNENGPPSPVADDLPAEAKDVLRRGSPWKDATCREVTLEDARVLVEILSDAGFELVGDQREDNADGGPGGFWMLTDPKGGAQPNHWVGIEFWIVLPDGETVGVGA